MKAFAITTPEATVVCIEWPMLHRKLSRAIYWYAQFTLGESGPREFDTVDLSTDPRTGGWRNRLGVVVPHADRDHVLRCWPDIYGGHGGQAAIDAEPYRVLLGGESRYDRARDLLPKYEEAR